MKNYQQSVRQRRVQLDKLKHAFAVKHNAVQHVSVQDKQWVLDSKQWQPMRGWLSRWF